MPALIYNYLLSNKLAEDVVPQPPCAPPSVKSPTLPPSVKFHVPDVRIISSVSNRTISINGLAYFFIILLPSMYPGINLQA